MAVTEITNTDRARVGVDKFHYAILTADTNAALTYGEFKAAPGTISIGVSLENVSGTLYADNKAVITYQSIGTATVTIERTTITDDMKKDIMGSPMVKSTRYVTPGTSSPYVGVAFRMLYSDGTYQYVKLYKGKFSEPELSVSTKGESIEFQTESIEGTFVSTIHEVNIGTAEAPRLVPLMMATLDETTEGYLPAEGAAWFTTMHTPIVPA